MAYAAAAAWKRALFEETNRVRFSVIRNISAGETLSQRINITQATAGNQGKKGPGRLRDLDKADVVVGQRLLSWAPPTMENEDEMMIEQ